jgi:hypothetical protein
MIRRIHFALFSLAERIWGMESMVNFHVRLAESMGRPDLANEVRIFWRRYTGEYK